MSAAGWEHEVLVIDDASVDGTAVLVEAIAAEHPQVRCMRSHHPRGFGFTVRSGLERFDGDAVAVMMADGSDDPADLVRYHELLEQGYDCVFGSRFVSGGRVYDYPRVKLMLNRLANWFIRALFRHGFNDTTNAFKAYRREVIQTIQPLLSNHFNLTVEIPLKAIVRGHSFAVIPISWRNRTSGQSNLAIQEMGSRYLFIVLYVFLEAPPEPRRLPPPRSSGLAAHERPAELQVPGLRASRRPGTRAPPPPPRPTGRARPGRPVA